MSKIPNGWLSDVTMKRVICHWTAGSYDASENDLDHYHIIIDGNGTIHRGEHTIADNLSTSDGDYAAHTRGLNRYSIGVSMCCMAGAKESPFDAGKYPMKKVQWEAMIDIVAQLCKHYAIPVTSTTVLGHGEVQKNVGVTQRGKWDPLKLPFDSGLNKDAVGKKLRVEVQAKLDSF